MAENEQTNRRLAAVSAADVVGYSLMMGAEAPGVKARATRENEGVRHQANSDQQAAAAIHQRARSGVVQAGHRSVAQWRQPRRRRDALDQRRPPPRARPQAL